MEIKECKLSENAHKNSYCDLEENNDEEIISESCAYIAKSSFTQLPPVLYSVFLISHCGCDFDNNVAVDFVDNRYII